MWLIIPDVTQMRMSLLCPLLPPHIISWIFFFFATVASDLLY